MIRIILPFDFSNHSDVDVVTMARREKRERESGPTTALSTSTSLYGNAIS